jgi:Ino eighty subunit 1
MATRTYSTVRPRLFNLNITHNSRLSVGYLSRKALPIKRNDAEPLTREDVQYGDISFVRVHVRPSILTSSAADLLYHIFADKTGVFHSPIPGKMCSFRDLYIHALYNSNKCSKVLKDKMVDTPAFGVELAKISLLTNVGRINTTMACEPFSFVPLPE